MSPERFEALVGYTRIPIVKMVASEIAWLSNRSESLLFTVLLCHQDWDFSVIVLARDSLKKYVCVDTSPTPFASYEEAINFIHNYLTELAAGRNYVSIDSRGTQEKYLFDILDEKKDLSQSFMKLKDSISFHAARGIISEMMHHFHDVDGNFIEQFQTTGFDSRIWELYLFAALKELDFYFDDSHKYPDYLVNKHGIEIGIEAVTVNKSSTLEYTGDDFVEQTQQFMPIKWGSPLYSKLNKRYWEHEHVKNKPFLLAIADFHGERSMLWSSTSLSYYLYGIKNKFNFDSDGHMVITPEVIEEHKYKDKVIPSAFFALEEAKHISGVLFSASGTLSKFNRMGVLAGFGHDDVVITRCGSAHHHNADSPIPKLFQFTIINGKYNELWREGLNIFHNPHALHPIDSSLFPQIAHHKLQPDGILMSESPEFSPYSSIDIISKYSAQDKEFKKMPDLQEKL